MFEPVGGDFDFPAAEQQVLEFWKRRKIFEKSLALRQGGPEFVFYEGPPTANGLPHPGHVLTRVIKDLMPRYKTMRGYHCSRKAGWDTHGLPVEIEVEKELGISGKDQIEAYGVEPFVRKCLDSVFRYVKEWEAMTERVGFWVDTGDPYVTCSRQYVESVWWAIREIDRKGLLYQGYKIVPYCPRCGTVLSSHEVGQGYQEVADPSIYVGFRSVDDPREHFLAWTTTPWTLISNAALVVRKDVDYARVQIGHSGEVLILAAELVEPVLGKLEHKVLGTVRGEQLLGRKYEPLYRFVEPDKPCWYVTEADFVTLDSGTGIVHCAPAFGADDYAVGQRYDLPVIQLVDPAGKFLPQVQPWAGMFIKDADPLIIEDLKKRKLLLRRETYRHSYPFCWRCETPLIYYARRGWFIKTTEKVQQLLENNGRINWLPEHIRDGRFGNFLQDNVDWALSRERYWGTPLPVWICENPGCGERRTFASSAELLQANPSAFEHFEKLKQQDSSLQENLALHKPYIDQVTVPCGKCGGTMRRTPEVIDCWFDSGCMPFAQWGYPHRNGQLFEKHFPADFISEAIDQTRGWFYSLLAISTLVFEDRPMPHPYKTCIVLGLVSGKDGKKLSKRLRNYDEPSVILEREGADALRWYFYFGQPPWSSARFDESAIAEAQREFLIRLYNVYSFFVIYANIDGFDPGDAGKLGKGGLRPAGDRSVLDRWILAELQNTIQSTTRRLDAYDIHGAAVGLSEFVDALSNWYVRRSRNRFWKSDLDQDKFDAYWTLYECLCTLTKLIAPFVPFLAESMYQNLVRSRNGDAEPESVHLCDWPAVHDELKDAKLCEQMDLVRDVVSLGRSARASAKLKVRQPLAEVEIVLADHSKTALLRDYLPLIQDELNVKRIQFVDHAEHYVDYQIKPNFKHIGPKFGKLAPRIKQKLAQIDAAAARRQLLSEGKFSLEVDGQPIELTGEDVEITLSAHTGYAAAEDGQAMVVLKTEIDEQLRLEGLARELVHHIQQVRKEMNLRYEARIELGVVCDEAMQPVLQSMGGYIQQETLARSLGREAIAGATEKEIRIDGSTLNVFVKEASDD